MSTLFWDSPMFRQRAHRVLIYVLAVSFLGFILLPYLWLVRTTISPHTEMLSVPPIWIPQKIDLSMFGAILFSDFFFEAFQNNVIISIATMVFVLAVGSLAAFAFARLPFPRKSALLRFLLFVQMIPEVSIIIPIFLYMNALGLIDTYLGLIFPIAAVQLPYVVWMLKGFFESVPPALEDAARIDGCNDFQALYKVFIPLVLPGLTAAAIFSFMGAWNSFFFPLILSGTNTKMLMPALTEFQAQLGLTVAYREGAIYPVVATGGVISSIPVVVLALVYQKWIIRGLTRGAVKG